MDNNIIREVIEYKDFFYIFKNGERKYSLNNLTEQELRFEFELFNAKGKILGYYQENDCKGIAMLIPRNKLKFSLFTIHRKDIFLSNIIILSNCQRETIFDGLIKHSKKITRELGYSNLCMQTNTSKSQFRKRKGFILDEIYIFDAIDVFVEGEKIRMETFFQNT